MTVLETINNVISLCDVKNDFLAIQIIVDDVIF